MELLVSHLPVRSPERPWSAPHGAAIAALTATAVLLGSAKLVRAETAPQRPARRPPTAIRPASGQVVGLWLELAQRTVVTPLAPEGAYRSQLTTLTLHPRAELRLKGFTPAEAGFWKGFVWMPVRFINRRERWEGPDGVLEARQFRVQMGPGRAGLAFWRSFPDRGTAIEATLAALLAPAEGNLSGWLGAAAGISASVVRDPVLAGAGWEAILEGGRAQRMEHRLSGYWRYFANESVVLTLGAAVRVDAADLRLAGHIRFGFGWLVRDGLQWEVALSQPFGEDGLFSLEVGVVTGTLQ